eukprot:jgi/Botrbrau1/21810/Bobra.0190s0030.1
MKQTLYSFTEVHLQTRHMQTIAPSSLSAIYPCNLKTKCLAWRARHITGGGPRGWEKCSLNTAVVSVRTSLWRCDSVSPETEEAPLSARSHLYKLETRLKLGSKNVGGLIPLGSPESHRSWESDGNLSEGNELLDKDADVWAFLQSLPKGVHVVCEREIEAGNPVASAAYGCIHVAVWKNRRYALKVVKLGNGDMGWNNVVPFKARLGQDPIQRKQAELISLERFQLRQEIRHVLHCHDIHGVAKCLGVVISDDVRPQVKGMLINNFTKGDLGRFYMHNRNLSCVLKVNIALELARTLDQMHGRNLIHGDVKPNNVLMGDNNHVYFCDFGCAAFVGDPPPLESSKRGTPAYMAPELWRGEPKTTATDVFAFGELLYNLMSHCYRLASCDDSTIEEAYKAGDIWFQEPPRDDWPLQWRNLVLSCMAPNPEDRPSASAVVHRLYEIRPC